MALLVVGLARTEVPENSSDSSIFFIMRGVGLEWFRAEESFVRCLDFPVCGGRRLAIRNLAVSEHIVLRAQ